MRILLAILFSFSCTCLLAQQNKSIRSSTKILNEEGKLQMIITYNPSCSCRIYTEFYTDGVIFAERIFKITDNGEYIDGEDKNFFHDGKIKDYKFWKNTVPFGRAYSNYENGKLEHEEFYEGKYKAGTWKYYDSLGNLIKELIYQPNTTPWNSKKEVATLRRYANGKMVVQELLKGNNATTNKKTTSFNLSAVQDGEKLFMLRCAACHAFGKDGFGPSLKGITKRRSNYWLAQWITDASKFMANGDADAIAISKKWNNKKHPQESLSKEQIQLVVDYLKKMN